MFDSALMGGEADVGPADPLHRRVRDPGHDPHPPAPDHRHPQRGRRAVPRRVERDHRRVRLARASRPAPTTPRSTWRPSCSPSPTRTIETRPDLRTPKVPEMAMITIPPFRITGRIHLLPAARAARGAERADRRVHPGHRGDLLVRHGRRGAHDRPRSSRSTTTAPTSSRRTRRSTRGAASTDRRRRAAPHRRRRADGAERLRPGRRRARGADSGWPRRAEVASGADSDATASAARTRLEPRSVW